MSVFKLGWCKIYKNYSESRLHCLAVIKKSKFRVWQMPYGCIHRLSTTSFPTAKVESKKGLCLLDRQTRQLCRLASVPERQKADSALPVFSTPDNMCVAVLSTHQASKQCFRANERAAFHSHSAPTGWGLSSQACTPTSDTSHKAQTVLPGTFKQTPKHWSSLTPSWVSVYLLEHLTELWETLVLYWCCGLDINQSPGTHEKAWSLERCYWEKVGPGGDPQVTRCVSMGAIPMRKLL